MAKEVKFDELNDVAGGVSETEADQKIRQAVKDSIYATDIRTNVETYVSQYATLEAERPVYFQELEKYLKVKGVKFYKGQLYKEQPALEGWPWW